MGISKNNGTPKWMVYKGKPYEQMDDLGVPSFWETPIYFFNCLFARATGSSIIIRIFANKMDVELFQNGPWYVAVLGGQLGDPSAIMNTHGLHTYSLGSNSKCLYL